MAKFCGKCGSQLDENTGICPKCGKNENKEPLKNNREKKKRVEKDKQSLKQKKKENKIAYKEYKKIKKSEMSFVKRFRKGLLKTVIIVLPITMVIVGAAGMAVESGAINPSSILSFLDSDELLVKLNKKSIKVEEKKIKMKDEKNGTAEIVVTIPDYEMMWKDAFKTKNPRRELIKKFLFKSYDVQSFEVTAEVVVKDGNRIIKSDEIVNQYVEESLIKAVNSVTEVSK